MSDRPANAHAQSRQVALSYAVVVTTVALGLQAVPASARRDLVLALSTDPDRLLQHPVRNLLLSPLVVPTLPGLWLLVGAVPAMVVVQRAFGRRVAVASGLLGHALVSVAVAVLLERDDEAPDSAAAADVGVSYVLAVTAGLALAALPMRWACAGALAGSAVTGTLLAVGRSSTDAGHLLGWLLGLALAGVLRRRADTEDPCST